MDAQITSGAEAMASASTIKTRRQRAADEAFGHYSDATRRHVAMMQDPAVSNVERSAHAHHMLRLERRWKEVAAALDAPTPAAEVGDRNRLACEGALLLSAIGAVVGIFLPDLLNTFWPLAITFGALAGLGAWGCHFTGRLAAHVGRRL